MIRAKVIVAITSAVVLPSSSYSQIGQRSIHDEASVVSEATPPTSMP
jgi:hypothetical protein